MAEPDVEDGIALMQRLTFAFEKIAQTQEEVKPVVNALTALSRVLPTLSDYRSTTNTPVNGHDQSSPTKSVTSRKRIRRVEAINQNNLEPAQPAKKTRTPPHLQKQSILEEQSRECVQNPIFFDFSYIPSLVRQDAPDFHDVSTGHVEQIPTLDRVQTGQREGRSVPTLSLGQAPPGQVEPQLLKYVGAIESDLFGRNWHEDWWI